MRRCLVAIVITLGVLWGVSACSPQLTVIDTAIPWIGVTTYPSTGDLGMDGGLHGYLDNFNDCLVVRPDGFPDANPDHFFLVLFPDDQVSFPSAGSVTLFGVAYHLGDTVSFRGGLGYGDYANIPSRCKSARDAAVKYDHSFITFS